MFRNLDVKGIGITGTQTEIIELALSFGFRGMSLDMDEFVKQVEMYDLAHARRLIDSAKIQIGWFRIQLVGEEEETEETTEVPEFNRFGEFAEALGCTRCLATLPPASDRRPYHENFEFYRNQIGQIAQQLQPHGVRVGLEFLAPPPLRKERAFQCVHTFDAALQLAKATAESNVGVVVDPWQLYVSGEGLDPVASLTADQIVAVFLSDIAPAAHLEEIEEDSRLPPGETNVIDPVAVISTLSRINYEGPVSPRAHRKNLSGRNRDQVIKNLGARLDQIFKDAGAEPATAVATAADG